MIKFFGYPHEVKVETEYKVTVPMTDETEARDEGLYIIEMMLDKDEDVKELDIRCESAEKEGNGYKLTIIADVQTNVVAHDYEEAFEEAQGVVESVRTPADVEFVRAGAYDYEYYKEEVLEYYAD